MKKRSYLIKYHALRSSRKLTGEPLLLRFLEDLNEREWASLFEDMALEKAPAYEIFLPPRGEEVLIYGSTLLRRVGGQTRELAGRSLHRLVLRGLSEPNSELLRGILFIAGVLSSKVMKGVLMDLVHQPQLPEDVRLQAGNALADYGADEVPMTFWDSVDLGHFPGLGPPVISAVSGILPQLALRKLFQIQAAPSDSSSFEYPVRLALRKLLAESDGRAKLLELYREARGWAAELLKGVASFSEFSGLSLDRLLAAPSYDRPSANFIPGLAHEVNGGHMPVVASILLDSGSFLKDNSTLWYASWRVGYFQCESSCPDVRVYADGDEVQTLKLGNGNSIIDVVHLDASGKGNVGIRKSNTVGLHLLKREVLYEVQTEMAIDETQFDCILHFHAGDFRCSTVKNRRFKEVDSTGAETSTHGKILGPIAHDVVAEYRLEDGDQLKFVKAGVDIWSSRSVNVKSRLEIEILADDSTALEYFMRPFGTRDCYWLPNQGNPPPTSDSP